MEVNEIQEPPQEKPVDLSSYPELTQTRPLFRRSFSFRKSPRYQEYFESHKDEIEEQEQIYNEMLRQKYGYVDRDDITQRPRNYIRVTPLATKGLSSESLIDASRKGDLEVSSVVEYVFKKSFLPKKYFIDFEEAIGKGEPDFNFPLISKAADANIYKLLVLKLSQGKLVDNGQKIETLESLDSFFEKSQTKLDKRALLDAATDLLSHANIRRLLDVGAITENNIPDFYSKVMDFAVSTALKTTFSGKDAKFTNPFPLGMRDELIKDPENHTHPDVSLLPFIAYSYLKMYVEIPENIRVNQQIDLKTLNDTLTTLQTFNESAMRRYMLDQLGAEDTGLAIGELFGKLKTSNPDAAQNIIFVNDAINYIALELKKSSPTLQSESFFNK